MPDVPVLGAGFDDDSEAAGLESAADLAESAAGLLSLADPSAGLSDEVDPPPLEA